MARDANGKFIGGGVSEPAENGGADIETHSPAGDGGLVDSQPLAGINPAEEVRRSRGRPAGSTKKTGQRSGSAKRKETPGAAETDNSARINSEPVNPDFVSFILMGVHEMAAVAFKAKELVLSDAEAKQLGYAASRVLELYNIRMTPAQEAWGMLIKVGANIYFPRIVEIRMRKKDEKLKNVTPSTVTNPPVQP